MRTAVCLFVFAGAALVCAQSVDHRDVNRTVPFAADGLLNIENHKGAIHITTWDRAEVEIHARIQPAPGEPMNMRRFEATEVIIEGGGDALQVRTKYPDWSSCCSSDEGNNPEVRYTIRMPRSGRLTIRDHRSEIQVADLAGALDIDTHRGTVNVARLSGPLQLTTHRGDATIEFSHFAATAVDTHSGTIQLLLPRSSGFELDGDTDRHASLTTDFTMITRAQGRRYGSSMHGSVNGGGPTLRITSHRGDIKVRGV